MNVQEDSKMDVTEDSSDSDEDNDNEAVILVLKKKVSGRWLLNKCYIIAQ